MAFRTHSGSSSAGRPRLFVGTWEKLSQVAVKGAEFASPERQPHPRCLEGTRVNVLNYIYQLLDDRERNRVVWLHGTTGIGKSAVAFTVAERMRSLNVTELTNVEKRLAGTFFFSRKHPKRSTTGYFFATLAYQLGSNFPSVREDVNRAIQENPALLDPNESLHAQMEALFLRPLRRLRFRLHEGLPLAFVIDALECISKAELVDLISLIGEALRQPDLPVTHILVTSRTESHIYNAFQTEVVRPLVCEIPARTSGEGIAAIISLDGADIDNDIYIFLRHSFVELQSRHHDFPQPSRDDLERLAKRAGRRFIVASTMLKFLVGGSGDIRRRLQLILELTSEHLPVTEVYKFYDDILSTCADPLRAYLHLSIVAALVDPLSISQISELLGPDQGNDVETSLIQLRSFVDIPTDSSLPVNIHHSFIRDYVSDPSNCGLPEAEAYDLPPPHSLLAHSCFDLMMQNIPESTALLDALSGLARQNHAMQPQDPQNLKHSLSFIVQPPEPLQVLTGLLWLRGNRGPDLQSWLETLDGRAWLQTQAGKDWFRSDEGKDWLETLEGCAWLPTQGGKDWLQSAGGEDWLQTQGGDGWLQTHGGKDWLWTERGQGWLWTTSGRGWLKTESGQGWLHIQNGRVWLKTEGGEDWLRTEGGEDWLKTHGGKDWLWTESGQDWLFTPGGRGWLHTPIGRSWLQIQSGRDWLQARGGIQDWLTGRGGVHAWLQAQGGVRAWLQTQGGRDWLQTQSGQDWLQTPGGRGWLQIKSGKDWLQTNDALSWLQNQSGQDWLQTTHGRDWLQTQGGRDFLRTEGGDGWLQTEGGDEWLQTLVGRDWLQAQSGQDWLRTEYGMDWLQTPVGKDWLQTKGGNDWLQTEGGKDWLQIETGRGWLQTQGGKDWLQTHGGKDWLQTQDGEVWLQTQGGKDWLWTESGRDWLGTASGRDWLRSESGRSWIQTRGGRGWLQTQGGRDWLQIQGRRDQLQTVNWRNRLQTQSAQDRLQSQSVQDQLRTQSIRDQQQIQRPLSRLQTRSAQDWLQTNHDQLSQLTPAVSASVWLTMEEFSSTLEAISEYTTIPELPLLPAFQAIQQFQSLPDFLMFPAFLALKHQDRSTSALPQRHFPPSMEIVHAMNAFITFADEAQEQSRAVSDTLKYACQNWAVHLSLASTPWDSAINYAFQAFWNRHLLSWLERQWCFKGLKSCLVILSEGQKLAKFGTFPRLIEEPFFGYTGVRTPLRIVRGPLGTVNAQPNKWSAINTGLLSIPEESQPPYTSELPTGGPSTPKTTVLTKELAVAPHMRIVPTQSPVSRTSIKRTSDEFPINSNNPPESKHPKYDKLPL